MNEAHICTKSGGKSRSGNRRRRDTRPRQQKSIKAREAYFVNGLTPDFSHGLQDFCTSFLSQEINSPGGQKTGCNNFHLLARCAACHLWVHNLISLPQYTPSPYA
jgi:hypothetical protein